MPRRMIRFLMSPAFDRAAAMFAGLVLAAAVAVLFW
jgi:hypothetical protein